MRRLTAWLWLVGATGLASGCREAERGAQDGSHLEIAWSGADSAKMGGPATSEWCDSLRVLQVQALRGDTGIALAIYPAGGLEAGRFPVVPPANADSARPAAAVALRWFAETSIRGFQGDSGQLVVEQAGSGLYTGTFEAEAHSVTDTTHLKIRGSFRGVAAHPAGRGCPGRRHPPDSGPGIH